MSYRVKKINSLDLKKSTGIGVKIPFSSKSVFTTVYSSKEQLKYNLLNFLLTNKRERLFNPNFGASLRKMLFENIGSSFSENLKDYMTYEIESNFPNIKISDMKVSSKPDLNRVEISFSYKIININDTDEVFLIIQN